MGGNSKDILLLNKDKLNFSIQLGYFNSSVVSKNYLLRWFVLYCLPMKPQA